MARPDHLPALEDATSVPEAIAVLRWDLTDRGNRGPLSHDKLAALIGTTKTSVIAWENGDAHPTQFVEQLAQYGVPMRLLETPGRVDLTVRLVKAEKELADLKEWVRRGFAALEAEPALQDEVRRALANNH